MSLRMISVAALLLGAVACSKADDKTSTDSQQAVTPAPPPAPAGKSIEIKLISDEKGNYFSPNTIEAHQGDVLHFVLVSGAHNVDFAATRNPGKSGLPAPSDVLQLPGQTFDLPVT